MYPQNRKAKRGHTLDKGFGETLKNLRTEKNLSQQQLANKMFVNRSSIANWENGRRIPDMVIISRLAGILGVDVTDLIGPGNIVKDLPEVIIVDDEPLLLKGAIHILSEVIPNANITGFSRASEAVEFSRLNRVDIAFVDIEMGKTSGLELCHTLTQINPLTNVIFLTSYPDYAIRAWDTQASGFIVKPLHTEDVTAELLKLRHPVGGL